MRPAESSSQSPAESAAIVRCAIPGAGPGALAAVGPLAQVAGVPILVHAVRVVAEAACIGSTTVLAPPADVAAARAALQRHRLDHAVSVVAEHDPRVALIDLLRALAAPVRVVVVHDAFRPLAPRSLVQTVMDGLVDGVDAVVPTLPVSDTVKQVDGSGTIVGTVPRDHLRMTQAPQAFRRAALEAVAAAMASGDIADAYDETEALERMGRRVATVPGSDEAFAVLNATDVVLAEAILRRRRISREG